MARITTAIRKVYPKPIRFRDAQHKGHLGEYCVGGALCSYYRDLIDYPYVLKACGMFPTTDMVAELLMRANPDLSEYLAKDYAACITTDNDKGHFRKAWEMAEEALTYTREQ